MGSLHRILAATDLSEPARHALDRAALLARVSGASLTLLHSIGGSALEDLRRLMTSDEVERAMDDRARRELATCAERLRHEHRITVEHRLCTGHPVEEIAAVADELRAELIVCGAHGGSPGRWLLGSTAERVVRSALRPVLLVRQPPKAPYARLLVPVDFSLWSEASIHAARQVAPGAHIVLLHAVDTSLTDRMRLDGVADAVIQQYRDAARSEAQELLDDLAGRAGLGTGEWTPAITLNTDPWTAATQQQQQAQACDLTVIGKQGRSALGEFLLGSVTRHVIAESAGDVLVTARGESIAQRGRP